MLERKQYGPMGYNMMYPFSIGDLRDSGVVLQNYMENSGEQMERQGARVYMCVSGSLFVLIDHWAAHGCYL